MTLVADPGFLLNLIASGSVPQVRKSLDLSVIAPDHCVSDQILFDSPASTAQEVLRQHEIVASGLKGDGEQNLYARFCSLVCEGEAASAAIAYDRGWTLGTDDPFLAKAFVGVRSESKTLTTVGLLKIWEPVAGVEIVGHAVRAISKKCGFCRLSDDVDGRWWRQRLTENQSALAQ